MAFTETFGGTTIYPSDVSYRAIGLSANQELSWPLEVATSGNVVAQIMDVTPSAGGFTITMPPANEASPGETALFFNAGSFNFTVADNAGNTIVTITPGLAYQVYLRTNTTVAGTWRTTQFGAGTSSATAGSLVGAGIKAINTTLNQSMAVTSLSVNYTAGAADRSAAFLWTGGAGTITLPAASTVGNDWFFHIRNGGTGAISLATTGGELINGTATVDFNPGDSAIIVCDGTGYFTIGFGQAPEFLFDYVSIDLTSQSSPYTLAGSNLNRIAYQFSGTLTTNMQIIVPATIQQYWVGNFTTGGSYTLTVKTSAGTGVVVPRDARSILYCNGTDVVTADTGGISIPILVSQGGTGATNASSARTNLGATSIGNALFIAVDEATARNAIIAAKSGANSDITSLTGLTTPLSVPQGGTGAATFTANGLIYGSGTSALGVTAVGTTGQVLVGNTGGAPSWATLSGIGVTSFSAGTTGLTPSAATSGAITLAGTLIVANGGTGATTLTGYVKGSGTSALTASATIPATDISGGAALTKTDDTNVTLTLGGTPASALLAATSLTLGWSGQLSVARGGTGQSSYTDGQLLIGNSTGNTLTKATLTAGTNVSITNGSGAITINATDQFVGTVTSVSGTGTVSGLTLTGTVTTSGNLTLGGTLAVTASDFASQTAKTFLAAPNASAGVPSFRAIIPADVPTLNQNTTGTASNVTGTVAVANGGTGATTLSSGYLVKGNGTSAVSASVVYDTGTNVGIGTSSPTYKLQVTGSASALRVDGTNTGTDILASFAGRGVFGIDAPGVGNGRFIVTDSGNVGIGTSSPVTRLTVDGGAASLRTGNQFRFYPTANNNYSQIYNPTGGQMAFDSGAGEAMRIDGSGNVGIGTSSPGVKFQIDQNQAAYSYFDYYNTTNAGGIVWRQIVRNLANTGTTSVDFAKLISSGFAINNNDTGAANFTSFGVGGAERMRINSSGNVGIGTASPTVKLDVAGGVNNTGAFRSISGGVDAIFGAAQFASGVVGIGSVSNHPITFNTNLTENMRITTAGNVGIGTASPAYKLDVNGVTRLGAGSPAILAGVGGAFVGGQGELYTISTNAMGLGTTGAASMQLYTNSTERMRIDSSGNVGIGTSSPDSKLQVIAGAVAGFRIGINNTSVNYYDADTQIFRAISGAEAMRIASGNVGIGTSSVTAGYRLQISAGTSAAMISSTTTSAGAIPKLTFLHAGNDEFSIVGGSYLGFLSSGTTERMRIDSSGNLLVGTTVTTATQTGVKIVPALGGQVGYIDISHANGTADGNGYLAFFYNATTIGSITQSGTTAVLYNTSSDVRLKDNITDADDTASLIDAIQVRKFDWKADGSHQRYGFVAQELIEVAPEAVSQPADPDAMMGVDYSKLVPMLVKEIQSLRARVAQLEGN